jgi:chemotaxis protein MotA
MNFTSILGFCFAGAVVFFATHESQGAEKILLNAHGAVIVLGGTLAASFICFPFKRLLYLGFLAFKKLLGISSIDYEAIIREVISVSEGAQRDPATLKTAAGSVKNLFLKEGLQLMSDGATEEQLIDIMEARIKTFKRRQAAEVNMFRTIGKFPPAFGLLGTTFGMIALLNQLGSPDAQSLIGPAMAIGLVATLYGIALTNFIFIPISENLNALNSEDYAARQMILEGLIMIRRKIHPILVEEKMKSFLLPSERSKVGSQATRKAG